MSHKEKRLNILNTLYARCFENGYLSLLITDEILKDTFPEMDDFNEIHPDLEYLKSEYLIYGDHPAGTDYLTHIRITENGIDEVESNNTKLRDRHWLTRLKILEWLYLQYYDKRYYIQTKYVADAIGFDDSKDPEFQMELTYLDKRGILKCSYGGGRAGILDVRIESIGFVESLIEDGIEEMRDLNDPRIKPLIKELDEKDDEKSRASLFVKCLNTSQQALEIVLKGTQLVRDSGIF